MKELSGETGERCQSAVSDWLTREELAAELKVAVRTIDTWRKRKVVSHTKIGRVIRFRRSQVLQELAAFERKAISK